MPWKSSENDLEFSDHLFSNREVSAQGRFACVPSAYPGGLLNSQIVVNRSTCQGHQKSLGLHEQQEAEFPNWQSYELWFWSQEVAHRTQVSQGWLLPNPTHPKLPRGSLETPGTLWLEQEGGGRSGGQIPPSPANEGDKRTMYPKAVGLNRQRKQMHLTGEKTRVRKTGDQEGGSYSETRETKGLQEERARSQM